MLDAIKYGLRNLTNLNGRDARQTFWYFVLFIYLINMAISMVVTLPMLLAGMARVFSAGVQNPEAAHGAMQGMMGDMIPPTLWTGVISGILFVAFLAASLVRRLHDSDLPGWLALIPGGLYAVALARMPGQMQAMLDVMAVKDGQDPTVAFSMFQGEMGIGLLFSWVPIILVIIAGVRKSSDGSNRYGDAPVSF
jgi:uncharacterized membrane protein YhaH (DUF805 family)